ncbi:hypothetical protein VD17_08330 [Pseudomonas fluorescens]|uniref:Uncharacterized protein n=1 Tax=Pseudomonas fluorescens TaxID=294 RepID=A0A0F4VED0_PSEFL|nr:hypothetical protein VD17_08330 [Pseudomonas fluorescens]
MNRECLQIFVRFKIDPSPQPSPHGGEGEREPIFMLFKPEFGSVTQVDVPRKITSVSPLSPRERVRVRVLFRP